MELRLVEPRTEAREKHLQEGMTDYICRWLVIFFFSEWKQLFLDKKKNVIKQLNPASIRLRSMCNEQPGPEVIKRFSYSTLLSMKFFLLIIIKMPTLLAF